jgi:hypothetical protein
MSTKGGTRLTRKAFHDEVGAIVGAFDITWTVSGEVVHSHMTGPLTTADKRGLREECDDGVAAPPFAFSIVLRRFLEQPDQNGTKAIVRAYVVTKMFVLRLSAVEVRKAQNTNATTGADLGDEPGVSYE